MEGNEGDRIPSDADDRIREFFHYGQAGRCISSVTHDVNNFLGAITAYADLIEMDSNLGAEGARMLNEIVEGARRCSTLLNSLVMVTRLERDDTTILDPVVLMESVVDLRRHYIKKQSVTLQTSYPRSCASISANQPRLAAGLLALVMNALEAVDDSSDGRIRLAIDSSEDMLNFYVWNSGPELSTEELTKLLHPYVSTRPGCHVGLGLDLARSAAEYHGGALEYAPEYGFRLSVSKSLAAIMRHEDVVR